VSDYCIECRKKTCIDARRLLRNLHEKSWSAQRKTKTRGEERNYTGLVEKELVKNLENLRVLCDFTLRSLRNVFLHGEYRDGKEDRGT
jgi:hypothetical protein